jgi:sugar lactone lactonase YvrE
LLLPVGAFAQSEAEVIDFDSNAWIKVNAEVNEHLGRKCLIGMAYMPNIAFKNGIIEYDVAVDGSRSYPGITFRATSMQEYENFYIRPHVSNLADAMQYTPVFSGVAGWQLYNGDGFTAAVEIPRNEWIHIKLEILGKQARVFVGEGDEPDLVIHDLKHDPVEAPIGIRSPRNMSAYFSNFRVTKTDDLVFDPPQIPVPPRGLITEWELSQVFRAVAVPRSDYPGEELLQTIEWSKVQAESNGLLDIARHVTRSRHTDVVFARVFLEADEDEVREFSFGYSDMANIYLDGKPVFSGNQAYRSRSQSYLGAIGLEDVLHLHLNKGRNELLFQVFENFGGWGVIGQDNADDYLHTGIAKSWELETDCSVPESAVYDKKRNVLYVSNYFNAGSEFISKIELDGKVEDRRWITGVNRPTGMAIHDDKLWVVDRSSLTEIDIETGKVIKQHVVPEPRFINDVAFDKQGNAYISDTEGSKLYKFSSGEFSVWMEGGEVHNPNGMLVDGGRLVFGNSGDGCVKSVDLSTKEVRTITCLGSGSIMDGLRPDGRGNYLVSDFNGRLFLVTPAGEKTELMNTTSSGAYCADFEYIADKQLLVVPGLYDNMLTAYRVEGI